MLRVRHWARWRYFRNTNAKESGVNWSKWETRNSRMRATHLSSLWDTRTTIPDSDLNARTNMESRANGISPMMSLCCWFWTKRKWSLFPGWQRTGTNFRAYPRLREQLQLASAIWSNAGLAHRLTVCQKATPLTRGSGGRVGRREHRALARR